MLADQFPNIADAHPELLAHHYTQAGDSRQTIDYWQLVGKRALQHSANFEAISHLTAELDLLMTLPDSPERAQQELTLQTTLGPALMAVKGQGSLEVEHSYARARELCQQVGETPQHFPVLFGLWRSYFVRAMYPTARILGEQCLNLAKQAHDAAVFSGFSARIVGPSHRHQANSVRSAGRWMLIIWSLLRKASDRP